MRPARKLATPEPYRGPISALACEWSRCHGAVPTPCTLLPARSAPSYWAGICWWDKWAHGDDQRRAVGSADSFITTPFPRPVPRAFARVNPDALGQTFAPLACTGLHPADTILNMASGWCYTDTWPINGLPGPCRVPSDREYRSICKQCDIAYQASLRTAACGGAAAPRSWVASQIRKLHRREK